MGNVQGKIMEKKQQETEQNRETRIKQRDQKQLEDGLLMATKPTSPSPPH